MMYINLKKINLVRNLVTKNILFVLIARSFTGYLILEKQNKRHFFHIVSESAYPINIAFLVWIILNFFVFYLHSQNTIYFSYIFYISVFLFLFNTYKWFINIINEGETEHTLMIQKSLYQSFIWFLSSEVMLFFSFFWAFLHSSLSPSIWLGAVWPPAGIISISYFGIPLLNTFILLLSGLSVTWAHIAIILAVKKKDLYISLIITLFLAILFTGLQSFEYLFSPFSINDSIYSSCFFMLTGFHGFHVIVGTIMLIISFIRAILNTFSSNNHVGFILSSWYWHFVDIIWILLYLLVYCWGNSSNNFNIIHGF